MSGLGRTGAKVEKWFTNKTERRLSQKEKLAQASSCVLCTALGARLPKLVQKSGLAFSPGVNLTC